MSLYEYGSALPIDTPFGSRYLGCYQDHRFERALSLKLASSNDMTPEVRSEMRMFSPWYSTGSRGQTV